MIKVHKYFLTAEVYVTEVWEHLATERYDAFDNMCVRACVCVSVCECV